LLFLFWYSFIIVRSFVLIQKNPKIKATSVPAKNEFRYAKRKKLALLPLFIVAFHFSQLCVSSIVAVRSDSFSFLTLHYNHFLNASTPYAFCLLAALVL